MSSLMSVSEMTARCHLTSGSGDMRPRCPGRNEKIIETLRQTAGGGGRVGGGGSVCLCTGLVLPTGNIITPDHNPESGRREGEKEEEE